MQTCYADVADGASPPFMRGLAMHALTMLVSSDTSGTILAQVLASGLITTLLEALREGNGGVGGVGDGWGNATSSGGGADVADDATIGTLTLLMEVAGTKEGSLALVSCGAIHTLSVSPAAAAGANALAESKNIGAGAPGRGAGRGAGDATREGQEQI